MIETVEISDDGNYSCVAINRQGNASSTAAVLVQGMSASCIPFTSFFQKIKLPEWLKIVNAAPQENRNTKSIVGIASRDFYFVFI